MRPEHQLQLKLLPPRINIAPAVAEFVDEIGPLLGPGFEVLNYSMTLDIMASEEALMTREYEMDTATAATEQDEWSDYDSDDESYVHSDAEDEDMLSDLEEEQDTEQDGEQDMRSSEGPPAKKGPVFDLLKRGVAPMDNPADPVNRDKIKSLYGECQTALNNIPGESSNRVTEYYTSGSRLPARTVHMVQADYSKGKEKADNTFQRTTKDTKLVKSIVSAIGGKKHRAAACSLLKAVGRLSVYQQRHEAANKKEYIGNREDVDVHSDKHRKKKKRKATKSKAKASMKQAKREASLEAEPPAAAAAAGNV